jgi:uncharacterized cupredoxin-like copper-binding protein
MNRLRLLVATLAVASMSVWAHTGTHEAAKPSYDYAKAEEMPFGKAADPRTAKRVIHVAMNDTMRFTPAKITVGKGEIVRFVARNDGKLMH